MKTNTKNQIQKERALSRPEQFSTPARIPIDFRKRRVNRTLNTESLLALLRKETPDFFALAEVVGKWVWIQFAGKQPADITRALAELGFTWNRRRQLWQHHGGTIAEVRATYDPRKRYGSYFAAAGKPA